MLDVRYKFDSVKPTHQNIALKNISLENVGGLKPLTPHTWNGPDTCTIVIDYNNNNNNN